MPRHFVYILQSISQPARFYTAFTEDLDARLLAHNNGCCDYTRPFRPRRFKTAVLFTDLDQARAFERYLKSPPAGPSPRSGCELFTRAPCMGVSGSKNPRRVRHSPEPVERATAEAAFSRGARRRDRP